MLEVRDTGPGFDHSVNGNGNGLQNMSDRIAAVGGRCAFGGGPGEGTCVVATVPVSTVTSANSRTTWCAEVDEHRGDPSVHVGFFEQVELREDRGDPLLDGADGEMKLARDRLITSSFGHQAEHLELGRRELGKWRARLPRGP